MVPPYKSGHYKLLQRLSLLPVVLISGERTIPANDEVENPSKRLFGGGGLERRTGPTVGALRAPKGLKRPSGRAFEGAWGPLKALRGL